MSTSKVLFLVQGFTVAASRYRVLQYLPYLQTAGIETRVAPFPDSPGGWRTVVPLIRDVDLVFVQRKRLPLYVLLGLRRFGKRIVYDFDDAVMFKNSLSANPYSLRRRLSFRRMLRFTDLAIAGNSFLQKEAEKYCGRVEVLPTPIDIDRYGMRSYDEKAEGVNIGWIGDHGSIHYMESYKDVWEELGRRHRNVSLTIICDTFIETSDIPVVHRVWSSEREVDYLQELDIGVMPLANDLWSWGKCGFKIIQYLGVGIPAVCTPVGINREVVVDGVNGFWAETKKEWVEKLSVLIGNEGLRREMGRAGRKKVLEGYSVQSCAPRMIGWLFEVHDRPHGG